MIGQNRDPLAVDFPLGDADRAGRRVGQAREPQIAGRPASRRPLFPPAVFAGGGIHQIRPGRAVQRRLDDVPVGAIIPVVGQQADARYRRRGLQIQRHRSRRDVRPKRGAVVGTGQMDAIDRLARLVGLLARNRGAARGQGQVFADVVVQRRRRHELIRRARRRNPERRRLAVGVFVVRCRQRHDLPRAPVRRSERPRRPALHPQARMARAAAHADRDVAFRGLVQPHEEPTFAAFADVDGILRNNRRRDRHSHRELAGVRIARGVPSRHRYHRVAAR